MFSDGNNSCIGFTLIFKIYRENSCHSNKVYMNDFST
jgi:hypothetical protein